jgi:hypothetical protein
LQILHQLQTILRHLRQGQTLTSRRLVAQPGFAAGALVPLHQRKLLLELFAGQAMLRPIGALLLAPLFWCFFQLLQRPAAQLRWDELWHLVPAALTFFCY